MQKRTNSWALTKSRGRGHVPAPSRFWKRLAVEGRGLSAPQPTTKGPGRRGGASASSGGGQAGSEHPTAPDRPARTWRLSGPPRELRCCFSWPWRESRRWQGPWPRAVRVSNCWSSGSGRSRAAVSALQDGAGQGAGVRKTPRPGPRPVTQGPEVPAGGRRCRGGTSEDPSPPLLSLHRRSAELGAVTRVRGLALSSAGQETPALSLPPHQAWVSVRKGCYAFALDRRECWMGFRKCSHPTAALTSYCYLTHNWFQKGRPRAASIDGPHRLPGSSLRREWAQAF